MSRGVCCFRSILLPDPLLAKIITLFLLHLIFCSGQEELNLLKDSVECLRNYDGKLLHHTSGQSSTT